MLKLDNLIKSAKIGFKNTPFSSYPFIVIVNTPGIQSRADSVINASQINLVGYVNASNDNSTTSQDFYQR